MNTHFSDYNRSRHCTLAPKDRSDVSHVLNYYNFLLCFLFCRHCSSTTQKLDYTEHVKIPSDAMGAYLNGILQN